MPVSDLYVLLINVPGESSKTNDRAYLEQNFIALVSNVCRPIDPPSCNWLSAGKSTTLRHFRDLETIEEWPSVMPPVMEKASISLEKNQGESVDQGLENAIWQKNIAISRIRTGIVAVDRAPLDFIAFPDAQEDAPGVTARTRGDRVLRRLKKDNFRDLCSGQVILLRAETDILVQRQLRRGRRTTPEEVKNGEHARYLKGQADRLEHVYREAIESGSAVHTDCCTVATSIKEAARIIHFEKYRPFNFAKRLQQIEEEH